MKEQDFGPAHTMTPPCKITIQRKCGSGFSNALSLELPLVAARNPQFRQPPNPDEHKQGEIRKRHGHCSRIISAVKPGPNAIRRP